MAMALRRILLKPASWAAAMPASTRSSPSRREIFWKVSSLSVSRLMLSRSRPARAQLGGLFGEQDAVGGEGEVVDAGQSGEHFDESRQVGPHERLAAGEPQSVHAHLRDDADESRRSLRT